jgi:hypothetical protein
LLWVLCVAKTLHAVNPFGNLATMLFLDERKEFGAVSICNSQLFTVSLLNALN